MALNDAVSSVSQTSSMPYQTSGPISRGSVSPGLCSASSLGLLAAGFACGAALGLLMAPTRGAVARAAVRDYANHTSERLQHLASSGAHWAEETLHQAMGVLEQGRRIFNRNTTGASSSPLTATVGERYRVSTGRSTDEFSSGM